MYDITNRLHYRGINIITIIIIIIVIIIIIILEWPSVTVDFIHTSRFYAAFWLF